MKHVKALLALLMAVLMMSSVLAVAGHAADPLTEKEPNNSSATATVFTASQSITGHLDDANDVDYFKFTTGSSGLVTVTFTAPKKGGTNSYFYVVVTDEEGTLLNSVSLKGDMDKADISFGSTAGDFYVCVSMGNVYTNDSYTIKTSIDAKARTESEPNNDVMNADPMDLSTKGVSKPYMGNLTSNDVDYYTFNITKPGYVYFYLYNGTTQKGTYKATMIAIHGDGVAREKALGSIILDANKESIMSATVSVGVSAFYLKVEGVNGSVGSYQTRVYYAEDAASEQEYNNESNAANELTFNKVLQGSTYDSYDVDFYRFSDSKATNLMITFDATAIKTDGSWNVVVYDASNMSTPVWQVLATNKKQESFNLPTNKNAAYYVKVTAGAAQNDGLYKLVLTQSGSSSSSSGSLWDKIKAMDWSLWKDALSFMAKINWLGVLGTLFGSFLPSLGSLVG